LLEKLFSGCRVSPSRVRCGRCFELGLCPEQLHHPLRSGIGRKWVQRACLESPPLLGGLNLPQGTVSCRPMVEAFGLGGPVPVGGGGFEALKGSGGGFSTPVSENDGRRIRGKPDRLLALSDRVCSVPPCPQGACPRI